MKTFRVWTAQVRLLFVRGALCLALASVIALLSASPASAALTTSTTTTLTSSPNPSCLGQPVTLTATVKPVVPGNGTPTGTVAFLEGTMTIGTGVLVGSGPETAVATFTTSTLSLGPHILTAVYSGDFFYDGSTSNPVIQVVNACSTCPPGDKDDVNGGGDNDENDGQGTPSKLALSGFSQLLLNSVQSDECDNDQNDGDSDNDRTGSDGD
jgi:hypothetical protein